MPLLYDFSGSKMGQNGVNFISFYLQKFGDEVPFSLNLGACNITNDSLILLLTRIKSKKILRISLNLNPNLTPKALEFLIAFKKSNRFLTQIEIDVGDFISDSHGEVTQDKFLVENLHFKIGKYLKCLDVLGVNIIY
jgi:hypothetical protein